MVTIIRYIALQAMAGTLVVWLLLEWLMGCGDGGACLLLP
jgi:hypothetical protein